MRRRPRPGEAVAEPEPVDAGPSLDLGVHSGMTGILPKSTPGPAVRRARGGRTILSAEEPTVTLDRRQSAIGSLEIRLAGPGWIGAVWELADGTAGIVSALSGVTTSQEFGRRSIVELREARLLVGLRHIHQLRRLLVVCGGATGEPGEPPRRLAFLMHDEESVECALPTGAGPVVAAVAGYQIDGELLLRREGFVIPDVESAARAYGFLANWLPPIRRGD